MEMRSLVSGLSVVIKADPHERRLPHDRVPSQSAGRAHVLLASIVRVFREFIAPTPVLPLALIWINCPSPCPAPPSPWSKSGCRKLLRCFSSLFYHLQEHVYNLHTATMSDFLLWGVDTHLPTTLFRQPTIGRFSAERANSFSK